MVAVFTFGGPSSDNALPASQNAVSALTPTSIPVAVSPPAATNTPPPPTFTLLPTATAAATAVPTFFSTNPLIPAAVAVPTPTPRPTMSPPLTIALPSTPLPPTPLLAPTPGIVRAYTWLLDVEGLYGETATTGYDPRLQCAMALSLDEESLISDTLPGITGTIRPERPLGSPPIVPASCEGFDPRRARLMLLELGFPNGIPLDILYAPGNDWTMQTLAKAIGIALAKEEPGLGIPMSFGRVPDMTSLSLDGIERHMELNSHRAGRAALVLKGQFEDATAIGGSNEPTNLGHDVTAQDVRVRFEHKWGRQGLVAGHR